MDVDDGGAGDGHDGGGAAGREMRQARGASCVSVSD